MKPAGESGLRELMGRTVDHRYVLRDWIGGGAFGGVFRAEQYILGKPVRSVACKLSRRTGMTEETAAGLFADVLLLAEAMDTLTDTEARRHLVHVYDGGLARDLDGRAYLIMEHVQGTTLAAEFAAMDRVPPRLMVKWARQMALALRGLHRMVPPLLHRDLKPDNVLLGTDRSVRLIDFGLAGRMLDLGHAPGTVGTTQYMAPETSAGASIPESDLYSLGLLMYEGLTGRHPYAHLTPPPALPERAHSDWLQEQKQQAPPLRPSTVSHSVGPELDSVVMRCLELSPARRFRGADRLLDALERVEATDLSADDARGTGVRTSSGGGGAPGGRSGPRGSAGPAGSAELALARRSRAAGDPAKAAEVLGHLIEHGSPAVELGPTLAGELAGAREDLGEFDAAARQWAAAYERVRAGAPLPEGTSRADLTGQAERAFRRAGNPFQAERFARLSRTEQGRR